MTDCGKLKGVNRLLGYDILTVSHPTCNRSANTSCAMMSELITDFVKNLYQHYLSESASAGQAGVEGKLEGGKERGLFYDVQNLSRVWDHQYILLTARSAPTMKTKVVPKNLALERVHMKVKIDQHVTQYSLQWDL